TDARNAKNFLLGDRIGLALSNGQAYAAWTATGTLAGDQNVYFARYNLTPAPVAEDDRYEPNDTPQTATDLGKITTQRIVPRLGLAAGDQDWSRVEAGATGDLIVTASATAAGAGLQLELWDATGTKRLATGSAVLASGAVTGQQISFHSTGGTKYLIRVS